jgi:hypothetical protein
MHPPSAQQVKSGIVSSPFGARRAGFGAFLLVGCLACGSAEDQAPRVIALSAGRTHTCARFDNGDLRCWGTAVAPSYVAPLVDLGGQPLQVGGGAYSACAILENQRVKCWGDNTYGQPGRSGNQAPGASKTVPYVELGDGVVVRKIAVGGFSACVLTMDDRVKCWGRNIYGQLGVGDKVDRGAAGTMGNDLPYVDLGSTAKPIDLALGLDSAFGRDNGSDIDDPGPRPGIETEIPFVDVGTGRTVTQIALGLLHTCVLLDGSEVKCGGQNEYGQLGLGDRRSRGIGTGEMGTRCRRSISVTTRA